MMRCQFCKKRTATIHFTNVVGSKVQKIHICRECAEEKGFEYLKKSNFEKNDLFAGLMTSTSFPEGSPGSGGLSVCGSCGRTYAEFSKSASLGCSKCYEEFRNGINKVLRSIHGDARHRGKSPRRMCTEKLHARRRIRELQEELNIAVEVEDYERAAELRDEIKWMRDSLEKEKKREEEDGAQK